MKRIFLIYGPFLFFGIILFFVTRFYEITLFVLFIYFYFLLILPGFCLIRFFKIRLPEYVSGQLVLTLTLGLILPLFLSLLAIIFGLTLEVLLKVYIFTIMILFFACLTLEFFRKENELNPRLHFKIKILLRNINFLYILPFSIAIITLFV